jgi:regulator of RNase E activity RraB
MNAPTPEGLSSQEEFDALIAIEDALTVELSDMTRCLYVGRNTSSGNRDFYFYVSDVPVFEVKASAFMKAFSSYQFETGGRFDPEWSTYRNFLYPSARDLRRIKNRHVCEALEAHGDDLGLVREIDHYCYVPSSAAASEIAAFATSNGFTVKSVFEPDKKNSMFEVHLVHSARPKDIDDAVLVLFEACLKLGGEYDGWGCSVAGAPTASAPE